MKTTQLIFFFSFLLLVGSLHAQKLLKGTVTDELGSPIPHAKVFVKNSTELRTVADVYGYYEMRLIPDEYFLFFSASGYDTREAYVTVSETAVTKDMVLFPTKIQNIQDINVSVKKSNPGRDIMLKVVARRDQTSPWNYPHIVHGYIKATEKITRKGDNEPENEKKKKRPQAPQTG